MHLMFCESPLPLCAGWQKTPYWGSNNWLDNFSFRIPVQWQIFVLPLLVLLVITLMTIFAVTVKAALDTPVKALKQDLSG